MKRFFYLLLLCGLFSNAQFSKTHYIPPVSNADQQAPQGQFMYISSPSLTPVNFKIIAIGGATVIGTVTRDEPFVFNIGTGFNTQFLVSRANVNLVMNNKGFIIEAEDLVYVAVRMTTTPEHFQGGGIVSKGLAALGKEFRVGALLNMNLATTNENHYTFASVMATENNTIVTFSDIKPGVQLLNNFAAGNTPAPVTLNRGESYVIAVQGPWNANRDALVGMRISTDKPVAVNCGSIAGTNGDLNNLDLGFDQIVGEERTGTEYIFIRGNGTDIVERPLIIGHGPGPTDVFLNGQTMTPVATLLPGQYLSLQGTDYDINGNLYVQTSQPVFAYQGLGGSLDQANQNMCFVPPLNCETPKVIDNIPLINRIGNNTNFTGTVSVVTETGATLSFVINGIAYSLTTLPAGVNAEGPIAVTGNPNYETYRFRGLQGNISVYSTRQVYVSYFGSSGFATYGGFYSGFTFKPEISFNPISVTAVNCLPNVELKVNALTAFDEFQWYFNDTVIPGATGLSYIPQEAPTGLGPGFYHVKAAISSCGTELVSDKIPVSSCATDRDQDGANDNIDIDGNNDGVVNCDQSYGDIAINQSAATGTIQSADGMFSVGFNSSTVPSGPQPPIPFSGNADGSFVSRVSAGIGNGISRTTTFASAVSIVLQYADTAAATDLLSSNGNFVLRVPVDKTLTVLNPDDQLLIDTNYDGVYESGISEYSSFEIRFRVNSGIPLVPGTGTFSFHANQVTSFTYIHNNLSDTDVNASSFNLFASCVPRDTDGDGVPDHLDIDSDNDGIPNYIETRGADYEPIVFNDENGNGLHDEFEPGLSVRDSDGDGVPDYLDLDSDNDGIYDLLEAGHGAADTDDNGRVDAVTGSNGLATILESSTEAGVINYVPADTDGVDEIPNYLDLDSDNDGCLDVTEAGLADGDFDGILGSAPVIVGGNGVITSATRSVPVNNDYITAAPITITTAPVSKIVCEMRFVNFTIETGPATSYRWQVSTDGVTYTDLSDDLVYVGSGTATLGIAEASMSMDGNLYRVYISRNGNACGLNSPPAQLTVLPRPVVPPTFTLKQCDDDLDGLSVFNLRQPESLISSNFATETFTYYRSAAAAQNADAAGLISNPTTYNNVAGNVVWVRVENADGCFHITEMQLVVTATQIPAGTSWSFAVCDDFLDVNGNDNADNDDRDGISAFDFSQVTTDIHAIMAGHSNYSISYYNNLEDALSETDDNGNSLAITNISNFRNISSPGVQQIYVRVDSDLDNSCFGLGPYITLTVENLPTANDIVIPRQCDRDTTDGVLDYAFDTSWIEPAILGGQTNVTVSYFRADGSALPSPLPNPFITGTETVRVWVTNNVTATTSGIACFDTTELQFVVDVQPVSDPVNIPAVCDDGPDDSDGKSSFDTSLIENTLLAGQTGMVVSYFSETGKALPSPLPNPFISGSQEVTAVVSNPLNPGCESVQLIAFQVNPLPSVGADITAADPVILCDTTPLRKVRIEAGLTPGSEGNFTFEWFFEGVVIPGAIAAHHFVDVPGSYTVLVTNRSTGCARSREIVVAFSSAAIITDIQISDLRDNNIVTVSQSGSGDYEYSLNDPLGPYQDNPVFEDVPAGLHTVYVRDKNECGTVSKDISVLGAPKFFTPNGDSYNDTWRITGINPIFYPRSNVQIFDRYGKFIMEIPGGSDIGWDGTYNGQPLPADDYWYVLRVDDGRIARGHFALKR